MYRPSGRLDAHRDREGHFIPDDGQLVTQQRVELDHFRPQHLTAAEGQQPPRKLLGPVSGALDRLQILAVRRRGTDAVAEKPRGTAQHGQEVVEVMPDAAGQLPHRLELLRLP